MLQYEKKEPDWKLVWARKYHREPHRLNMAGRGYTDIVKKFIRENPGSPSKIDTAKLERLAQPLVRDALIAFYRETTKSLPPSDLKTNRRNH